MQRVIRATKAHEEYLQYREALADSDDDDGPQDEDGWLYEDLNVLAKLYAQLRDKEQLIELLFEVGGQAISNVVISPHDIYRELSRTYSRISSPSSIPRSPKSTRPQASRTR